MIDLEATVKATGSFENVILSQDLYDALINELSDESKEKLKEQFADKLNIVPLVIKEPEEDLYMSWSIYTDTSAYDVDDWIEDHSTNAPDGVYDVTYNYLNRASGTEHGVVVKNGQFQNKEEILTLVAKARNKAGYWGTFLEALSFDGEGFIAVIGS